jgi:hypothetical protein
VRLAHDRLVAGLARMIVHDRAEERIAAFPAYQASRVVTTLRVASLQA